MASAKREKKERIDGLASEDLDKIRVALRKVWSWHYSRRLVLKRCTGEDGFPYCEICSSKVPKVFIDHIEPAGAVDDGFIRRLFVPSANLQALCQRCHKEKTKLDNKETKRKKSEVTC